MGARADTGAVCGNVAHLANWLLPSCCPSFGAALVWTSRHLSSLSLVLLSPLFFPCLLAGSWGGWLRGATGAKADSAPLSTVVQEELGRSPAKSAALLTVDETAEQVSPPKAWG